MLAYCCIIDVASSLEDDWSRTMTSISAKYSGKNVALLKIRGGEADNDVVEEDAEADCDAEEESKVASTADAETGEVTKEDEEVEENEKEDSTGSGTAENEEDEEDEEEIEDPTELRLKGKECHDQGDFIQAAKLFKKAADSIQQRKAVGKDDGESDEVEADNNDDATTTEEFVTCRLHEALCHLKSENYEDCIVACSNVLEGDETYSPAVKARAYHRRAKAKLALEDSSGALQDARSAAFLGDRRAVAFYGKLMRESSPFGNGDGGGDSSSSALQGLANSPSASLLESMLGKSSDSSSAGGMPDFNPASLLFGGNSPGGSGGNNILESLMSGAAGGKDGKGTSSLAKSVMSSLYKRLDDEATQTKISGYLQSANKQQLQSLATMAGFSDNIQDSHYDKVLEICHGVTPKKIRRTVKYSKRAVYVGKLVRKISRIIDKYKTFFVAIALFQWSKSAALRPLPTDRRAAKRATKKAIKEAMKKT